MAVAGGPDRPDAWLLTVARNRPRDQWKSAPAQRTVPLEATRDPLAHIDDLDVDSVPDRRLELMLVCAHPAINRAVRTPLMLNTVLGFTAEQVGRALSVPPTTMATRLPSEALHLAEVLTTLAPGDAEARGLAALIELSAARAPARVDPSGRFVPLAKQDPARWDQHLIGRAHVHLRAAHAHGQLGRFQLEAAIQAVHCARGRDGTTDWPSLLTLHRILQAVAPSLGSSAALAAVTAEVDGPAAGLATLDELLAEAGPSARRFQPAQATRAHLLDRLGRAREAVAAYEVALSLTHDTAERQYLEHRRDRGGRPEQHGPP